MGRPFSSMMNFISCRSKSMDPWANRCCRRAVARRLRGEYLFGTVAMACLDDLLCLFVGEAAVGANDRAGDVRFFYVGILVEGEDDREAELLFLRPQGADVVAQPLGQHGYGAVDQVYRRAPLVGFAVDGASSLT